MPKFTLIAEHKDFFGRQLSKTTHEFEVDHIGDVLENVDLFLRGAGFNPDGTLDYIQEDFNSENLMDYGDNPEWTTQEWSTPPDITGHSEFYFDTERNK